MTRALLAAALAHLLAGAPAPGGAGSRGVDVDGVPITGIAGTIRSQGVDGAALVLGLDGREIRVVPWPGQEKPPRLVGQSIEATTSPHPEGPSQRVEIGPTPGNPRWIVGTSLRRAFPVVGRFRLGRATAGDDGAEVAVQAGNEVVARVKAGGAVLLRAGDARWCVRILAIRLPARPSGRDAGQADMREETQVDLFAYRLRSTKERCPGAVTVR